ncbi:biotin--[acetyl-CoA-carboxylase] ligase [Thalassorhabdus alkalitolerans]|uniref:Bifunctional ligase/repressor BirA n=2 Tax=Thalassorhabdus alkalitolerans TaxID=2282697 RepID=A0ABW0YP41_9BACI
MDKGADGSMRGKLIQVLTEAGNEFTSGQYLSEQLGISRTAVWKHIEELRKSGYELEAVPRKGYRLLFTPDTVSAEEISSRLTTSIMGAQVHYEKSVPSTQEVAHKLARDGAAEGTVIVADEQTKGKGRLGREWFSPPGTGLWFSLLLRPDIPPQQAPQLTLLTAVAVIEGIEEATGVKAEIKWPNDLLVQGRKIAGILTEMQSEPDRVQAVIVGVGINVNQEKSSLPEDLQSIATSLAIEKGTPFHRADVLTSVLKRYEYWYQHFLHEGFDRVRRRWEALAISFGQKITARTVQGAEYGTAKGITDDGVLILEKEDGEIKYIYSADIEFNNDTN